MELLEMIENRIDTLTRVINLLAGETTTTTKRAYHRKTKPRQISKAGRARIAAAQKKRWAVHNKAKKAASNQRKRIKAVTGK